MINYKWHELILHVKHKIAISVGILYKIRHYLHKETLLNMYYTFMFPYLIYGVEIWGSVFRKTRNRNLHKFATTR